MNEIDINKLSTQLEQVVNAYCEKYAINKSNEWFLLKTQEELGELVQVYLEANGKSRDRGTSIEHQSQFEAELADVICVLLAMAKFNNVDVMRAIENKWLKWVK